MQKIQAELSKLTPEVKAKVESTATQLLKRLPPRLFYDHKQAVQIATERALALQKVFDLPKKP